MEWNAVFIICNSLTAHKVTVFANFNKIKKKIPVSYINTQLTGTFIKWT